MTAQAPAKVLQPSLSAEGPHLALKPTYCPEAGLWVYGNVRLLESSLVYIPAALGPDVHLPRELEELEREAEFHVLESRTLVCGIHSAAHKRIAVVPLRWGSPRIVVLSGGFCHHLGQSLDQEPFRTARLWRYVWDPLTDMAISRRAPEKLPTYACHNPTVDRLIQRIAGEPALRASLSYRQRSPYLR